MARKKNNGNKSWQRRPSGKRGFTPMFYDLLDSEAFTSLTCKQRMLYVYCCRESHGQAMRDNALEGGEGDERMFYLNRELYVHRYKLYGENDRRGFNRDMAALIGHGFVDCIKSGLATREKNLYRLSSRWHHYGTPAFSMPDSLKSTHMLIAEDKARREKQKAVDGGHHAMVTEVTKEDAKTA